MRAYQIVGDWGLNNLRLVDLPDPQPLRGQVLIAMSAAALNARDLIVPERGYGRATGEIPLIPVSDGVGRVIAVGEGVTRVAVGDRVCPTYFQDWICGDPSPARFASALGGPLDGVMAEQVCVSENGVVKVPDYLSDEQAATLPCAGLTAWSAMSTLSQTRAGDKVLIQGTGGVALFALAFAKMLGAHVTVISSSDDKLERAKDLGADQTLNYQQVPDWAKATRDLTVDRGGFDKIVELGGETTLPLSLKAIRPGGTIALIGVLSGLKLNASLGPIVTRQVRLQGVTVGHRDGFEAMLRAMDVNKMSPVIDRVYPFEAFLTGLEQLRSSQRVGKTVVRIAS